MHLNTNWHRFLSDRSGGIMPIFALVVAALLVSVGMGLDYARALNDRVESQAVADAMVLAMAQQLRLGHSHDAARNAARRIYDTHYGSGSNAPGLEIREIAGSSGYDVTVAFPGRTETTLMKLGGFDEVPWQVRATTRVGFGTIELTFVADISNSMLEPGRMEALRASLHELVQIVFPEGRTPPNRVVTLVPFSETVNLGTNPTVFAWLDRKLYQMDEATGFGVDPVLIDPATGKNRIVEFVGCFRRETVAAITNPAPIGIGNLAPFIQDYNGKYPFCPSDNAKVVFFENDPSVLRSAINRLDNGYSTGTDEGLMWGWRTLSPAWRGKFPASGRHPLDFPMAKKVLILLTDGMVQPMDVYGDWVADRNPLTRVNTGIARLTAICEAIRREGRVEVHTILYAVPKLTGNGPAARSRRAVMECPSNGGRSYEAGVAELTSTVQQIVASVNSVQLLE